MGYLGRAVGSLVKVGGEVAGGIENVKGRIGAVGGPMQVVVVNRGAEKDPRPVPFSVPDPRRCPCWCSHCLAEMGHCLLAPPVLSGFLYSFPL